MTRNKINFSAAAYTVAAAVTLPPAHAEGLTVPVTGDSRMCLTGPAVHRFTEAGSALRAGRPARLTGSDRLRGPAGHRGAVSLDLAAGGTAMGGSITFEDRRRSLTLSDLYSHLGGARTSAEVTVGTSAEVTVGCDRARPIERAALLRRGHRPTADLIRSATGAPGSR
ncbi:hypothetical protein [Streptomyces paromomycinus]|uniref:Uncharacterized protein n=1 Tax=Streptomyces paromomycinus TaxID=92743 RepID=A0A401VVT0_STREY|nr:hypothetical protein [Streptomyces paromomycinus]GCD41158.1 hypothetical protein GKJPGBOP_00811 [Streptomyces paromomycinus]